MHFRPKFWLAGCALLVVIPFSSCSRNPQVRKQKYFDSGQRYFEKGQYPEAAIQFTNAIKVDPNYTEAHHQLAESYLRLQKPQGAFQELGRALQLQPGNHEIRIELANLLILGRNLPEAKDQVELL